MALFTTNIKAGSNAFAPVTTKDKTKYKGVACQTKPNKRMVLLKIF